jgi:hypothetical protein
MQQDFVDSVSRLRERWGFNAVWTSLRTATTVADKPWIENTKSSQDYTIEIVRATGSNTTAAKLRSQVTAKDTGNVTLNSVAVIYVFAPLDFTPALEDVVTIGSEVYRVVSIEAVSPTDTTLMYIVGLIQ